MLFADLRTSPEYASFYSRFPVVVDTAINFGKHLELECADLLRPEGERGAIKVIEGVGAVIARDVLKVDITKKVIDEHEAAGIGWMQSHNGSWFYSDFVLRNDRYTATEKRLQQVCIRALDKTPKFVTNRYDFKEDKSGFQFPHRDLEFRLPSIAFGSGPGATRGQKIDSSTMVPYSINGVDVMADLIENGEAVDIDTGSYDIAVFDGTLFTHHGIRIPPSQETGDSRFSFLVRFK
jgi:hypothetical protein